MKIWTHVSYYLKYLNFTRGDSKIAAFFQDDEYNRAIKELIEEGYYQIYDKFIELINTYIYSNPLNQKEEFFINEIKGKFHKVRKYNIPIDKFNSKILITEAFISNFINTSINFDKDYSIKILEKELENLKDIIKKLRPLAEAIILRRFIKKLLEKFIAKNFNDIDIENYYPDTKILESYNDSLTKYYFFRKGINKDIQTLINELIVQAKTLEIKNIKQKKYPKLKSSNKTINDVIQILFNIKNQCNKFIHFEDKMTQNLMIDELIIGELNNEEEIKENVIEDNTNTINNGNNNIEKTELIKITKIVNFITYGNNNVQTLNKLKEIKNNIKNKVKNIKVEINNLGQNGIYNCGKYIEDMNQMLKKVRKILNNLPLKIFSINISEENLEILSESLLTNPLNINELEINEGYNGIEKDINYINQQRKSMDIKNKIKLNITLYDNVNLIYIEKNANELIKKLNDIEKIDKQIESLNNYFDEILNISVLENKTDKLINFFNRDNIFKAIEKPQFIDIFKNQFKEDEYIDVYEREINNFYFYTFLLKKNLYDETSYKNVQYEEENYI